MKQIVFYLFLVVLLFVTLTCNAQLNYRAKTMVVTDSIKIGETWYTPSNFKSLKPESWPSHGDRQMTKQEFYETLNSIRAGFGYQPLKKSIRLEYKAESWLTFLQRHDLGMVHDEQTNDGEVLTNAYEYLRWWMYSPRHRAVLLGRKWRRIGVAEKNGVWCARLD